MHDRYSRQTLFAPIGPDGQARLIAARVAIIGMGALGTVLANHMVRAGVGYVRLIDRDFVEPSNLQRQMLYDEADAAALKPKALAAADHLRRVNSLVTIEPHVVDLNSTNAEQLLDGIDVVLDGSDNFAVRFLVNDVCVKLGIPWIYGGAVSARGVTTTIVPGVTACLRCLFGQPTEPGTTATCDTAGVIGPIIHVVASYQATEALKFIVQDEQHRSPDMVQLDLWHNQFTSINIAKARRPDCPCCAAKRFDYLDAYLDGETLQSLCGRNSVQIHPVTPHKLNLNEWALRWQAIGPVEANPFLIKLHLPDDRRLILFADGRVMVQGTADLTVAKSLYSRYIGM
jgi:molybdopterin/thiamine biosynthesis adenylyltransferase